MNRNRLLFSVALFLLPSLNANAAPRDEQSLDQYFGKFHGITYVSPDGWASDIHLELVSIDYRKREAIFTKTRVIAEETNEQYEGKCANPKYKPTLYRSDGSSSEVRCKSSGLCFILRDEVQEKPELVLISDGNISVREGDESHKMWPSSSNGYYTCTSN